MATLKGVGARRASGVPIFRRDRISLIGDSVADYAIAGKYVLRSYDESYTVTRLKVSADVAADAYWSCRWVYEAASHDELVGFVEAAVKP